MAFVDGLGRQFQSINTVLRLDPWVSSSRSHIFTVIQPYSRAFLPAQRPSVTLTSYLPIDMDSNSQVDNNQGLQKMLPYMNLPMVPPVLFRFAFPLPASRVESTTMSSFGREPTLSSSVHCRQATWDPPSPSQTSSPASSCSGYRAPPGSSAGPFTPTSGCQAPVCGHAQPHSPP